MSQIRHIVCLLAFSSCVLLCRADEWKINHFFDAMSASRTISFSNSNKVGTTDEVTYTCSGTDAAFVPYNGSVCLGLPKSGNKVLTAPAIENLDSIRIEYQPNAFKNIDVYISEDNETWTSCTVTHKINGVKTIKMPAKGTYFVKITNPSASNDFYIRRIEYITVECPCFPVRYE